MSTLRLVLRNFIALLTGEAFAKFFSLIFIMILSRTYGPEGFGVYAFTYSLVSLFDFVLDFGTSPYLIREGAREPERMKSLISSIFGMKIALFVLIALGFTAWLRVTSYAQSGMILYFLLWLLFESLTQTLNFGLRAKDDMKYEAILRSVEKGIVCGAAGIAAILGKPLLFVVAGICFSNGLRFLATLAITTRKEMLTWPTWDQGILHLTHHSFYFAIAVLFSGIYYKIDTLMIAAYLGEMSAGYYAAGQRILDNLLFIPGALVMSVYPLFSRTQEQEKLFSWYNKAAKLLIAVSIPVVIACLIDAEAIVTLIYGDLFLPSAPALRVLSVSFALLFAVTLAGTTLRAMNHERYNAFVLAGTVGLNAFLNMLLIPRYGILGAAWSTAFAIMTCIIAYVIHTRNLLPRELPSLLFKPFLAGGIMAGALVLGDGSHLLVRLFLGSIAYLMSLLLLRYFNEEERKRVFTSLRL